MSAASARPVRRLRAFRIGLLWIVLCGALMAPIGMASAAAPDVVDATASSRAMADGEPEDGTETDDFPLLASVLTGVGAAAVVIAFLEFRRRRRPTDKD